MRQEEIQRKRQNEMRERDGETKRNTMGQRKGDTRDRTKKVKQKRQI